MSHIIRDILCGGMCGLCRVRVINRHLWRMGRVCLAILNIAVDMMVYELEIKVNRINVFAELPVSEK